MAYIQIFYGNMDWWEVAEQPSASVLLPADFLICENLWRSNAINNQGEIIKLLQPYIGSSFLIENIPKYKNFFDFDDELQTTAIEAYSVKLISVDFNSSPLPKCKTEAFYKIPMKDNFRKIPASEWQTTDGLLTDAVSFRWIIDAPELDLTFGNNAGVECIPISNDSE